MPSRPVTEMSREEILAEIERMQEFKVPTSPVAKAPKRTRDVKPRAARRGGWRAKLGLED